MPRSRMSPPTYSRSTSNSNPSGHRSRRSSPHRNDLSPTHTTFLKRSNRKSRSQSPRRRKKERSSSRESSPERQLKTFNFEADDEEASKTFHCKHCQVKLHDPVSMKSHLNGKPHLLKLKRLKDNENRLNVKMEGEDHSGRVPKLSEKKRVGQRSLMDEDEVEECENKSKEEYRIEASDLKKKIKAMQNKVEELQEFKKLCVDSHENEEFLELLEHNKQCIKNHQRPVEMQKRGIYCKQEKGRREGSYHDSDGGRDRDRNRNIKSERSRRECSDEEGDRKRSFKSEWRECYYLESDEERDKKRIIKSVERKHSYKADKNRDMKRCVKSEYHESDEDRDRKKSSKLKWREGSYHESDEEENKKRIIKSEERKYSHELDKNRDRKRCVKSERKEHLYLESDEDRDRRRSFKSERRVHSFHESDEDGDRKKSMKPEWREGSYYESDEERDKKGIIKSEGRKYSYESDKNRDMKRRVKPEWGSYEGGKVITGEKNGSRVDEIKSERRSGEGGTGSCKLEQRFGEERKSEKKEYVEREMKSESNLNVDIILLE